MEYFCYLGYKSNELIVIDEGRTKDSRNRKQWLCKCSCGNEVYLLTNQIMNNKFKLRRKNCGNCNWKEKHKDAYISWRAMHQRCYDPNKEGYQYYGGKGIQVCERWFKFVRFYEDMLDPPIDQYTGQRFTLDREDNSKDYCLANCSWQTTAYQNANKG